MNDHFSRRNEIFLSSRVVSRDPDEAKMKEMAQLTPFFNHENLPWMNPAYCDGDWA